MVVDPEVEAITATAASTLIDAAGLTPTGIDVQLDVYIRIYAFLEGAD